MLIDVYIHVTRLKEVEDNEKLPFIFVIQPHMIFPTKAFMFTLEYVNKHY